MRRWLSLSLIAAIVLASCASEPPSVDWCYTYNLAVSLPSGITITSGEWQPGIGLAADETGELIVSFSEAFFIEPEYFTLWAIRLDDPGDIDVAANVSVFGLDALINETMPGILDEVQITVERDDDEPIAAGTTVSATMQTTGGIAISQLDLGGFGASPYSSNLCGAPTPEPSETPPEVTVTNTPGPTGTPAATATPTITLTNSITPTPTATQFNSCSLEYDFTVTDGGFDPFNYPGASSGALQGIWTPGVGWQGEFENTAAIGNNWVGALSIFLDFPEEMWVSSVEWTFAKTAGNQASTTAIREFLYFPTISSQKHSVASNTVTSGTYSISGSWEMNVGDDFRYVHGYHQDTTSPYTSSGSFTLTELNFYGICIVPSPTPTQTFTATPPTPTITNTPNLTHSPTFTRTSIGGGTGTPSRTPTRTALPTISTPTPNTPPPTVTMANTLPPPTPPPTQTFIPQPTMMGTSTAEATYIVPGFGTVAPNITAVSTSPAIGTLAPSGGHSDIYNLLGTAVVEVNLLPGSFTGYVPNPDITPMVGYAKWFMSCTALQEILGQNIGVAACHASVGLILIVILSAVYTSLRIVVLVMKFAIWVFLQIRNLIPFV